MSKLTDISGEIRHETEKAYLFFDGTVEEWIPKSRCQWDPDAKEMTMPESLAIEKGFI